MVTFGHGTQPSRLWNGEEHTPPGMVPPRPNPYTGGLSAPFR